MDAEHQPTDVVVRSVDQSGAVRSSAIPSGSLNGSTAMPNGRRSVMVLCSMPRSSKARTAASNSARPATAKLKAFAGGGAGLFGLFEQPSAPLFLLTALEIFLEGSPAPCLTLQGI